MLLSVSLDFRLERAVGFIFTYHIYYIMINFMVSFKSNSDAFSPNVHWSVLEIEIPSIGGKGFCLPNVGFSLLVFFLEEERALQASSHLNLKASGLHHHCSGYCLPGSSKEDVTLCSFHILLQLLQTLGGGTTMNSRSISNLSLAGVNDCPYGWRYVLVFIRTKSTDNVCITSGQVHDLFVLFFYPVQERTLILL